MNLQIPVNMLLLSVHISKSYLLSLYCPYKHVVCTHTYVEIYEYIYTTCSPGQCEIAFPSFSLFFFNGTFTLCLPLARFLRKQPNMKITITLSSNLCHPLFVHKYKIFSIHFHTGQKVIVSKYALCKIHSFSKCSFSRCVLSYKYRTCLLYTSSFSQ